MKNSLPILLDEMRPTLGDIAEWAGVSRGLANFWREGKYQPNPVARRDLLKATRRHAERLLALADKVEREGAAANGTRPRKRGRE